MLLISGIIGGIVLFLGRELTFLFAGSMAALFAVRLTPLLPAGWPAWSDNAFIIGLGVIAMLIALLHERVGFALSGFLAGGYFLVEYFAPHGPPLPLLPFIVGSVTGAVIIGILGEWAMIAISSVIGAYYLTSLFTLPPMERILVTAGLVVIGALTQAYLLYLQRQSER
ncbi:MAG TPA: hypothetical protein VNK49_04335 [Anaerolineales bacterium]|nr:hypothetical protein [Anaerolineales bacterium]